MLSKVPANWNIQTYLADHKIRIEKRLRELPLGKGKPTRAREAMRYALDTPGKRFRPLLAIATADIYQKGHLGLVLDGGVAIECIHTASLIFDDLPCMDDAHLRRGRLPTHLVYDESQAILAAMSLIAEANQLLSRPARERTHMRLKRLECLHRLNASFSIEGLSGGQSDDLLNKSESTLDQLEFIHAKKTGALFEACVEIPAILAEATQQERRWLNAFAKNLGLAFQIRDDLLDLQDSEITGKSSKQDKVTFVELVGIEKSRALYDQLMDAALANLEAFGDSAFHLKALTRVIRKRSF